MAIYQRDEYAEKHSTGPGWRFWLGWITATLIGSVISRALADWISLFHLAEGFGDIIEQVLTGLALGLGVGVAQAIVLLPNLKFVGAIQWIGATTVGRLARLLLVSALSGILLNSIPQSAYVDQFFAIVVLYFVIMAALGVVAGAALGFVQRLVLERRVANAYRWIWATIGTSMLTFIAFAVVNYSSIAGPYRLNMGGGRLGGGPWIVNYGSALDVGPTFDILNDIVVAAILGYVLIDMLRHPTTRAEWSVDLREKRKSRSKPAVETQLSPEAMLERHRKE